MTETTDIWLVRLMFVGIVCIIIGAFIGNYAASFTIPTCKIWENNRTYDKILIADDVICQPTSELNTTYWRYDIANYNGTSYLVQMVQVSNTTAKGMIVCH
jgi:hypothetical protein